MSTYLYAFSSKPRRFVVDGMVDQLFLFKFKTGSVFGRGMEEVVTRFCDSAEKAWDKSTRDPSDIRYFIFADDNRSIEEGQEVYKTKRTPQTCWYDSQPMPGDAEEVGTLTKVGRSWGLKLKEEIKV